MIEIFFAMSSILVVCCRPSSLGLPDFAGFELSNITAELWYPVEMPSPKREPRKNINNSYYVSLQLT